MNVRDSTAQSRRRGGYHTTFIGNGRQSRAATPRCHRRSVDRLTMLTELDSRLSRHGLAASERQRHRLRARGPCGTAAQSYGTAQQSMSMGVTASMRPVSSNLATPCHAAGSSVGASPARASSAGGDTREPESTDVGAKSSPLPWARGSFCAASAPARGLGRKLYRPPLAFGGGGAGEGPRMSPSAAIAAGASFGAPVSGARAPVFAFGVARRMRMSASLGDGMDIASIPLSSGSSTLPRWCWLGVFAMCISVCHDIELVGTSRGAGT